MSDPRLSVVTPTHRRPDNLRLLLDSLAGQTLSRDRFEIVVVDDASGDVTGNVLREATLRLPNLRYEQLGSNSGPARARNRGIELATGDMIVFLDDDVAAVPDLLREHLSFHEQHRDPWHALLGRVDWHPDLRITPFMRWLDRSDLQFAFDTWLEEGEIAEPYKAFYMANISIHRESLLAVGGFDERFPFPAFEDYELGWRLAQHGLRASYLPRARAYHTRAIDLRTFRRRMRMVAESAVILRSIHPEFPLYEILTRDRLKGWKLLKHLAYAPIARLVGDELRLGRFYRELVASSYAAGRRAGKARLTNPSPNGADDTAR